MSYTRYGDGPNNPSDAVHFGIGKLHAIMENPVCSLPNWIRVRERRSVVLARATGREQCGTTRLDLYRNNSLGRRSVWIFYERLCRWHSDIVHVYYAILVREPANASVSFSIASCTLVLVLLVLYNRTYTSCGHGPNPGRPRREVYRAQVYPSLQKNCLNLSKYVSAV